MLLHPQELENSAIPDEKFPAHETGNSLRRNRQGTGA
jgi:hypothetical protein